MIQEEVTKNGLDSKESKAYPTIKQCWGMIGILILVIIGYSIPLGILSIALESINEGPFLLLNYAIPFVILILITRIWWKKNPMNKGTLQFKPFPISILPLVLIVCASMLIINVEISSWVPMPDFLRQLFEDMLEPSIWGFLTVAVAAPILEEILMRGIVLEGMLRNYSPWKAIIWSALFFGIMHLNPWQLVIGVIAGIAIGYLYWKTRSLLLCILMHAINNGFAFYMSLKYPDFDSISQIFELGVAFRVGIFLLALLTLLFSYKFFETYFRKSPASENV